MKINSLKFNNSTIHKMYHGNELVNKIGDAFTYMEASGDTPTPPTPVPYEEQYLTIEALTAGDLSLTGARSNFNYSLDNGSTWNVLANNQTVAVNAGEKVLLKANRPIVYYDSGIGKINYSGQFNLYGNIMSLVYGDDFIGQETIASTQFYKLFSGATTLISAENLILPATTLKALCYMSMFNGCTSLTTAPSILPATTLDSQCYRAMFGGCTSLTAAPELPATTLATYCYQYMFSGCSNLKYIKCLATDISAKDCTYQWVKDVTSTGTFVKAASMNDWTSGKNGIPSGWDVEDAD